MWFYMMLKTAALFYDSGDEFKASPRDTCRMTHATEDLGFIATASAEKVSQTLTANRNKDINVRLLSTSWWFFVF